MLKILLAGASFLLALGVFVGLGFLAHDGGSIPYQGTGAEYVAGA
jgi:hypothetical protein